ncbi:MAG: YggS family pyridoxal phosphate-dependent enzyme [Gallionella sp.]
MTTIASNLQAVRTAIAKAAVRAGRSTDEVTLLAVSKTFSHVAIRTAHLAGQIRFAENYVQEAIEKIAALHDLTLEWHFIGPIQSNKTRIIAEKFSWVHSVDRLKIAERLSEQRPKNLPALQICLQVNISAEKSKSGISPEEVDELAIAISKLPQIRLRGLMAIPAPVENVILQRQPFTQLKEMLERLNNQGLNLDTLSMGMSHDFSAAISEGATMVRIGTAIFGNRHYGEQN